VEPVEIGSFQYRGEELVIYRSRYSSNNRDAVFMLTRSRRRAIALSCNLPDDLPMGDGEFAVAAWKLTEELAGELLSLGIFAQTDHGFEMDNRLAPVWRFRVVKSFPGIEN